MNNVSGLIMSLPPPLKTPNLWKILSIVLLIVVIIMGAIVGILANNPSSTNQGTGTNNQVQVSGTVYETQFGKIEFTSTSAGVSTSVLIVDGKYNLVLRGGYSYNIAIYQSASSYYSDWQYSLYVPTGVTTFTGNF